MNNPLRILAVISSLVLMAGFVFYKSGGTQQPPDETPSPAVTSSSQAPLVLPTSSPVTEATLAPEMMPSSKSGRIVEGLEVPVMPSSKSGPILDRLEAPVLPSSKSGLIVEPSEAPVKLMPSPTP